MKLYNRLWYKAEEDMRRYNKGALVCYEHDDPKCKKCPRCKDSELCEFCWKDLNEHTDNQTRKCLKKLNQTAYEYKELESMIGKICSHSLVMKEIKMDGETIWVRDMNKRNQK